MKPKRPLSFTLLALFLWWISFGAVGAIFVFSSGMAVLALAFSAYAITGFTSGYALWTLKPWAANVFAAWAVTVLLNALLFVFFQYGGPLLASAAFLILCAALLWWGYRHVRAKVPAYV